MGQANKSRTHKILMHLVRNVSTIKLNDDMLKWSFKLTKYKRGITLSFKHVNKWYIILEGTGSCYLVINFLNHLNDYSGIQTFWASFKLISDSTVRSGYLFSLKAHSYFLTMICTILNTHLSVYFSIRWAECIILNKSSQYLQT